VATGGLLSGAWSRNLMAEAEGKRSVAHWVGVGALALAAAVAGFLVALSTANGPGDVVTTDEAFGDTDQRFHVEMEQQGSRTRSACPRAWTR